MQPTRHARLPAPPPCPFSSFGSLPDAGRGTGTIRPCTPSPPGMQGLALAPERRTMTSTQAWILVLSVAVIALIQVIGLFRAT